MSDCPDLIRKGDALSAILDISNIGGVDGKTLHLCFETVGKIRPASVPKEPRRKWEYVGLVYRGTRFRCPCCGTEEEIKTVLGKPVQKFCGECGARMEV